MADLYKYIGNKIREMRRAYGGGKGLRQDELAEKVGTTANTVSRWESATYKPSAKDLHKLSVLFGVSISVFFPQKEDPQVQALLSATGDLRQEEMEDLIEYARFRRARRNLKDAKGKK
jgi:transcriptional regulator with XRE-family HTH domain